MKSFGVPFPFITAWFVLCCCSSLAAEASTTTFDKMEIGKTPPGWMASITGQGKSIWTVELDASAPSQPKVLKQSGQVPKGSFPLCIKTDAALQDGFVEVNFKPVGGAIDQAAGLVWRWQDDQNYYVARANALEDNVVLYKVEKGRRQALDIVGQTSGYGQKQKIPPGEWSRLRVSFHGPDFQVQHDGKVLFAVRDATFKTAGKLGVWTKADSITLFDDFKYGPE